MDVIKPFKDDDEIRIEGQDIFYLHDKERRRHDIITSYYLPFMHTCIHHRNLFAGLT